MTGWLFIGRLDRWHVFNNGDVAEMSRMSKEPTFWNLKRVGKVFRHIFNFKISMYCSGLFKLYFIKPVTCTVYCKCSFFLITSNRKKDGKQPGHKCKWKRADMQRQHAHPRHLPHVVHIHAYKIKESKSEPNITKKTHCLGYSSVLTYMSVLWWESFLPVKEIFK